MTCLFTASKNVQLMRVKYISHGNSIHYEYLQLCAVRAIDRYIGCY